MHDLCKELELICKHISYYKREDKNHERAVVFKVGNLIGKVEIILSENIIGAYDKMKVSVINTGVGEIDSTEIEFRYILGNECYLKVDDSSADWYTSRRSAKELTEKEYGLIGATVENYLKGFE